MSPSGGGVGVRPSVRVRPPNRWWPGGHEFIRWLGRPPEPDTGPVSPQKDGTARSCRCAAETEDTSTDMDWPVEVSRHTPVARHPDSDQRSTERGVLLSGAY